MPAGYWLFVGVQAGLVALTWGVLNAMYGGDSGCGGPDVEIPNCR